MMNRICGLFAGAVVACVGVLSGCSDDVSFRWNEYQDARIVGFVDDSLAIVTDCRHWIETTEGWNGSYDEETGRGHTRLCLYNYRVQLNGPVWCDSLDDKNSHNVYVEQGPVKGQLSDSIVWGGSVGRSISFWKIGEKPHEMQMSEKYEGCSVGFEPQRLRTWLDGKVLALGETMNVENVNACQYAVLDTNEKTITYKRLDENLKWIQKCDDVRAWDEDVYCLFYDTDFANVYLKIDNKVKDSMVVENQGWYSGAFFEGHLILVDGNLCDYKDSWVCYPRQGILKIGFHAENGIILNF